MLDRMGMGWTQTNRRGGGVGLSGKDLSRAKTRGSTRAMWIRQGWLGSRLQGGGLLVESRPMSRPPLYFLVIAVLGLMLGVQPLKAQQTAPASAPGT
jgi:hypothetical protein